MAPKKPSKPGKQIGSDYFGEEKKRPTLADKTRDPIVTGFRRIGSFSGKGPRDMHKSIIAEMDPRPVSVLKDAPAEVRRKILDRFK